MDADMKLLEDIVKRVKNLNEDQQKEILKILEEMQKGRQREYQRIETRAEIDVVVGDRVIQTNAKDLCAGGIFINASGKFEINKSVRIVFSVSGHDKPFKLQGKIVRVEKTGVAICFENITPYFKKILDDVIWKNKL